MSNFLDYTNTEPHAYKSTDSTIYERTNKVRVHFRVDATPGSLAKALAVFSKLKINCERIESQPEGDGFHVIFVDVSSDTPSELLQKAVRKIDAALPFARTAAVSKESSVPWFPRRMVDLDSFATKVLSFGAELDADHPGFLDAEYRERRKAIVDNARTWRTGMPLPTISYTQLEIDTWRSVYLKLTQLFPTHACKEYLAVFPIMERHCGMGPDRIPQLHEVNDFLQQTTGFRLRPVMGLLSPRDFLNGLAFRVFHATQYIRHHSRPFYTPEPDVIHEILGHCPLLASPEFAQFSQEIGLASLGATDEEIVQLSTLYWFSVEFGICREGTAIKAYGAGLLSSFGELQYCIESAEPQRLPFNPEAVARQDYPITKYQPVYFVAESFARATRQLKDYCSKFERPFGITFDAYTMRVRLLDTNEEKARIAKEIERLAAALATSLATH